MSLIPVDDFWLNGWGPNGAGPDYDQPGWIYDQGVAWDGTAWVPINQTTLPAAFVQLALNNNALDANPTWTTLDGVLEIQTDAGRNHALDRMMAGSLRATLNNRTRHYDPMYTGGPYGSSLVPLKPVRVVGGYNLLTANQSSLESGTATGWNNAVGILGAALSASTETTAPDGIYVLKIQARHTTDQFVNTGKGTAGSPFGAGVAFAACVDVLAKTTARSVAIEVYFYDALGNFLSQQSAFATDSSTAWTTLNIRGTSPADTAYATVSVHVVGCVAGEVHYLDKAGLFCSVSPTPTWTPGSLNTIFTGFVESYTVNRASEAESTTELVAYDLFKLLSYKLCRDTKYRDAVKALSPDVYYRMDDHPTAVANRLSTSGVLKDQQGYVDGYVEGNPAVTSGPLITDPSTGLNFSVNAGNAGVFDVTNRVRPGTELPFTVMLWMKTSSQGVNVPNASQEVWANGAILLLGYQNPDNSAGFALWLGTTPWTGGNTTVLFPVVNHSDSGPNHAVFTRGGAPTINDGNWHHVTVTRTPDGQTMSVYVDGSAVSVTANFGSTSGVTSQENFSSLWFAGTGGTNADIALKDVAIWNSTCLSAAQVQAAYSAAIFPSETVGARLNRVLDLVGVPAAWRALDTGPTLQAYKSDLTHTAALEHMQTVVDSDGGNLFVDAQGVVRYYALSRAAPAPVATFSDTGGANEIPYSPGQGPFIDDQDIFNEISVVGDSIGSLLVDDLASQAAYGVRTKQISNCQLLNVADATTTTNALLAAFKQPVARVVNLTFTPQAVPALGFTQATGRTLLDRITYKQKGVPGSPGAATTTSQFIEQIRHQIRPLELWRTTYALSPY